MIFDKVVLRLMVLTATRKTPDIPRYLRPLTQLDLLMLFVAQKAPLLHFLLQNRLLTTLLQ